MRKGAWPLFSFDLVATHDSFIALSAALEPLAEANREAAKNRAGAYARIRPVYMEALLEKAGGLLAGCQCAARELRPGEGRRHWRRPVLQTPDHVGALSKSTRAAAISTRRRSSSTPSRPGRSTSTAATCCGRWPRWMVRDVCWTRWACH